MQVVRTIVVILVLKLLGKKELVVGHLDLDHHVQIVQEEDTKWQN